MKMAFFPLVSKGKAHLSYQPAGTDSEDLKGGWLDTVAKRKGTPAEVDRQWSLMGHAPPENF